YDLGHMYGQSKLANGLFARELARRLTGTTTTSNVLHPGYIKTKIQYVDVPLYTRAYFWLAGLFYSSKLFEKTVPQGAATTCYVAANPDLAKVNGAYFEDCNIVVPG